MNDTGLFRMPESMPESTAELTQHAGTPALPELTAYFEYSRSLPEPNVKYKLLNSMQTHTMQIPFASTRKTVGYNVCVPLPLESCQTFALWLRCTGLSVAADW